VDADQQRLIENIISDGIEAIVVKTATLGLNKSHVGMDLSTLLPHLGQNRAECCRRGWRIRNNSVGFTAVPKEDCN